MVNEEKESDYYILGDTFLRAYYSIYDMDQNRVGLVKLSEELKQTYGNYKYNYTWVIVISVIVGVCVLTSIVVCIRRRYKNNEKAQVHAAQDHVEMPELDSGSRL